LALRCAGTASSRERHGDHREATLDTSVVLSADNKLVSLKENAIINSQNATINSQGNESDITNSITITLLLRAADYGRAEVPVRVKRAARVPSAGIKHSQWTLSFLV
jgi:hypothetical protein